MGRGDHAKEAAIVRKTATEVPSDIARCRRGMTKMAGGCGEINRVLGWMRPRDEIEIVATWEKREMDPSRWWIGSSCVNQQNSVEVESCFFQLVPEWIGTIRVLAPSKILSMAINKLLCK